MPWRPSRENATGVAVAAIDSHPDAGMRSIGGGDVRGVWVSAGTGHAERLLSYYKEFTDISHMAVHFERRMMGMGDVSAGH